MEHPHYLLRAYDALKKFTQKNPDHYGMTIAVGKEKNIKRATINLYDHPANSEKIIRPELRDMFEMYEHKPVLFGDEIYYVFGVMTNEQRHVDSLLAINTRGYLIKMDGFLVASRKAFAGVEDYDGRWGTRHWACAAASFYDIYTMALSRRRKTITVFHKGKIINMEVKNGGK